jgi:ParB family transcriptional regulator, chromosome partitioning protein
VASEARRGTRNFGLGRGLEALIPRGGGPGGVQELAVELIARNPHQPRTRFDEDTLTELAASIALHGVLQPIVVRATHHGAYELIAGERRLRAARTAGLSHVPAVIRESADTELLQLALIENVQRADLNAIEEAGAYRELIRRFGLTHDQVAGQVGKSRVAVSNALRLLELAAETREAIVEGRISEGHGRALAAITIPDLQRAVLQLVLDRHLSVRQTEELVRRKREPARTRDRKPLSDDLADLEAQLRGLLATRVGIVRTRRGGRLVIDFFNDEELDRIYSIITRGVRSSGQTAVPIEIGSRADARDAGPSVHRDEP